jgi:hypothetical protein
VEVTKSPKPSMQRTARRSRKQTGRNVSERRAGLETINVGADPPNARGRPLLELPGERTDPSLQSHRGSGDSMSAQEIGHNTGDPRWWVRDPTGRPRGIDRAAGGVGEVHSTVEAG